MKHSSQGKSEGERQKNDVVLSAQMRAALLKLRDQSLITEKYNELSIELIQFDFASRGKADQKLSLSKKTL